jgi:FkbH-like protein
MAAASVDPLDELLHRHQQGTLASSYPSVPDLVRRLTSEQLPQAGRLLARLDPDEVVRLHPQVPSLTVAVTGHGTLAALVPALTGELAAAGLLARTVLSDFDAYVFDLSDPGSALYTADPDLALCLLDPAIVTDELPLPWRVDDVERVLAEKLTLIEGLAATFARHARGTLVLNTVPLPAAVTAQLVDHRSRARLGAAWREANARLLRLAERDGVIVLDLDPILAEGVAADEPRLRVYARANLAPALLARYAHEIGRLAAHLSGRTRKCLVLDLDGTVWGGVLGDDGVEGIEVADSYRGEAFRAFQRVAKQLASQGVLLAAVSKNDLDPVRSALRDHPGMTLRENDFLRVTANWRPKHDNLRELAETLNIGLDSVVFVDDSPYECGLVRQELPEVAVVQLDDEPALHAQRLLAGGWFDARGLTDEDRARPARYREELSREDFLSTFDSLAGYLRELGVTVRLGGLVEADVPRVSQLTLRTNQFNLTTVRLQPPQVQALLSDPEAEVFTIRSADRFGDNGLVGVIFTHRLQSRVQIDNVLLSCRVFSRGIEQACLAGVLRRAAGSGATGVQATYRRSARNGKVADFWAGLGFDLVDDDGTTRTYHHDLHEIPEPPEHVRLTDSFERSRA